MREKNVHKHDFGDCFENNECNNKLVVMKFNEYWYDNIPLYND